MDSDVDKSRRRAALEISERTTSLELRLETMMKDYKSYVLINEAEKNFDLKTMQIINHKIIHDLLIKHGKDATIDIINGVIISIISCIAIIARIENDDEEATVD